MNQVNNDALLTKVIETSPVGIVMTDRNGRITLANRYAERILGLKKESITQRTYDDPSWKITDFDGNPMSEDELPFFLVRAGGETVTNIRHAIEKEDGERRFLSINASPLIDDSGVFDGMVAALEDITQRVASEMELKNNIAMLESVFRAAPVGIGMVKDRVLTWSNTKLHEITGYSGEELVDRSARILYSSDREFEYVGREKYRQIDLHGTGTVETHWLTKDGRLIDVLLSSTPIDLEDLRKGVTFSALDITDRKNLEARVRQADKMEAVGQLAGGIAHDFNNQLAGIVGFADILLAQVGDDELATQYIENILISAKRASDLTSQLLAFARKGKYLSVAVDIHNILFEVVSLLRHSIDKRIVIEQHLTADPCLTKGDPSQLQNALLNLAINARDAMQDGGLLTLSTGIVSYDTPQSMSSLFDLQPGRYLTVEVADTGTGIDPSLGNRIFEPFFTTKSEGEGAGMGLAAVFGTVKNHNGAVSVESEPGKGTTMTLFLPLYDGRGDTLPPEERKTAPPDVPSDIRVLVVDDEEIILDMATEILKIRGYRVVVARSGKEALSYYENGESLFDLVILDLVMPEMNGSDTFHAIKKRAPNSRVLIASGYSVEGEATELLRAGADGFIQKPFRTAELIGKIQNVFREKQR